VARLFSARKNPGSRSLVGTTTTQPGRTSLDRRSCTWRDAVGVGFVSGPTQGVLDLVSSSTEARYGRR